MPAARDRSAPIRVSVLDPWPHHEAIPASIPAYTMLSMCSSMRAGADESYHPALGTYLVNGSKPCCFHASGNQG